MTRIKPPGSKLFAKVGQKGQPLREAAVRKPYVPSRPQPVEQVAHDNRRLRKWAPQGGRAFPWTVAVLMGGGMSFYMVKIYQAMNQPCHNPDIAAVDKQKDVSARYEEIADSFDTEVGMSELLMRLHKDRKRLAKQCTGHVLEASCGTGRNLGYFDIGKSSKVDSLTFVDLSPAMVEVCKKKWDALHGTAIQTHQDDPRKSKFKQGLSIRFLTGSALGLMPLAPVEESVAPGGKKYDTIIQTMGLCSVPDPTHLITNLAGHLDASNPDARILLLEHGRGTWDKLNRALDNAAEKHAEIHGCWFNREIGAIISDAAEKTGLEVVTEKRRHFGTTWIVELKPGKKMVEAGGVKLPEATSRDQNVLGGAIGGWLSWVGSK